MSTSDQGLGGPLKKPAAKGLDGKPLAAKPLAASPGKTLGDAPAPTPAAPTGAPATPMSFEFDDAPAPHKEQAKPAPAAPAFNPFDQPVSTSGPAAAVVERSDQPGTARVDKPATGRTEKPGTGTLAKGGNGRIDKPGTSKLSKPIVSDPMIGDIAPGLAKDLWTCPHCGAKNKPNRESCRECRKLATDPVEKSWFMNPVIIGPVAGGLIVLVLLIMWMNSVDLSLRPAGTLDNKVRAASITHEELEVGDNRRLSVKKTAAVSGRVITVSEYAAAPWITAVVVGLGNQASDDAIFSTWSAEYDGDGYAVKAPRYATLFLIFNDNKPQLKAGDYLSVVGKAGVAEQDHTIVKGTELPNCWTIKVEQIETR